VIPGVGVPSSAVTRGSGADAAARPAAPSAPDDGQGASFAAMLGLVQALPPPAPVPVPDSATSRDPASPEEAAAQVAALAAESELSTGLDAALRMAHAPRQVVPLPAVAMPGHSSKSAAPQGRALGVWSDPGRVPRGPMARPAPVPLPLEPMPGAGSVVRHPVASPLLGPVTNPALEPGQPPPIQTTATPRALAVPLPVLATPLDTAIGTAPAPHAVHAAIVHAAHGEAGRERSRRDGDSGRGRALDVRADEGNGQADTHPIPLPPGARADSSAHRAVASPTTAASAATPSDSGPRADATVSVPLGEDGSEGQLRVSRRGDTVRAVILSTDADAVRQMQVQLDGLRESLRERGFRDARVTVQHMRPPESAAIRSPAARAGDDPGADSRRDAHPERDDAATEQDTPRRQAPRRDQKGR
jgi:hypothetical protein